MTHIKCSHCGLINWPGAEVCDRCGTQLQTGEPEAQASEPLQPNSPEPETHTPPPVRPDFPALTFAYDISTGSRTLKLVLVVLVALVVGGAGWAMWYKQRASSRRGSQAKKQFVPPTVEERTRDAVLSGLHNPVSSEQKSSSKSSTRMLCLLSRVRA